MENLPIEIKFAQNLAGNETKTRLKALKKLKKYLRAKSAPKKDGFSFEDLLKLWKGLHYCMWMQDKPLLQEELSGTLTQLVHDLSTVEAQMMFVRAYFITEAREWNSIDVWRLDKFMMMMRNMLNESLTVVKKLKWETKSLEQLTQVFSDCVMNPLSDNIPDGMKIHFSDIYLDEVEKVGQGHLTGAQLLKLLVPFIKFMQKAKNLTLLKRVKSYVFDLVITRLTDGLRLQRAGGQAGSSEDSKENEEVPLLSLKFDGKLISDYLFQVSQDSSVLTRNRPMIYGIITKLKDIESGVLPVQKEIVIEETVSHTDIQKAVNDLINLDNNKNKKKKLKKIQNKKAKRQGQLSDEANQDLNNNVESEGECDSDQEATSPHVGEKRKLTNSGNNSNSALNKAKKKKLDSENTGGEKTTLKKLMNKFSKLDMKKSKKDKGMIEGNVTVQPQQQQQQKQQQQQQRKHQQQKQQPEKKKEENAIIVNRNNVDANMQDTSKKHNKKQVGVFTVEAEVPSSMTKIVEKTPNTQKKGKRKFSPAMEDDASPKAKSGPSNSQVPNIVVQEATPVAKPSGNDSDMVDGEVEIWVPNKRFKGNNNATPTSNFASFDHSKPPVAFVKRSLSKSLKKTPSALKAPGSGRTPGSDKRVCFNMKKNKAQAFKDSLNSPLTPFNPTKKPDTGILKSPALTSFTATATTNQGSGKRTSGSVSSVQSTPITRHTVQTAAAKRSTPVVSIGFERKKVTPVRRKNAADFFL